MEIASDGTNEVTLRIPRQRARIFFRITDHLLESSSDRFAQRQECLLSRVH